VAAMLPKCGALGLEAASPRPVFRLLERHGAVHSLGRAYRTPAALRRAAIAHDRSARRAQVTCAAAAEGTATGGGSEQPRRRRDRLLPCDGASLCSAPLLERIAAQ